MPADKVSPTVAPKGDMVEAVVRRGTVKWGGHPFHDRTDDDGLTQPRHSGPGEKVLLPRADVERLRRRGVLQNPQEPEIPVGLGPNFNIEDGVQIRGEEGPAASPPA